MGPFTDSIDMLWPIMGLPRNSGDYKSENTFETSFKEKDL